MTTIEHFVDRFGREPDYEQVSKWATIVSYNIYSTKDKESVRSIAAH